ncbi:hypothetical protein KKF29_03855, partial [Patescibacteria group bacterium]|nr:hypothetical protein [Patescibacteria group bacterium]
ELDLGQIRLSDGGIPKLFDIIKFPALDPRPNYFQPENFLIQEGQVWCKTGVFDEDRIGDLLDSPDSLWRNGGGKNDNVPRDILQKEPASASLYFINPQSFKIHNVERPSGSIQTRAIFMYSGVEYDLVVTDPESKDDFLKIGKGDFSLDKDIYLCISLGEAFQGCHYKLIASVTQQDKRQNTVASAVSEKKYSVGKIRQDHPKAYQKWTQDDDATLKKEFQSGKSTKTLAGFFMRKIGAIRSRLKKLGLISYRKEGA